MSLDIITSEKGFYAKAREIIKSGSHVRVATYNLWTGVLEDGRYTNEWGPQYKNRVGEFFDELAVLGCKVEVKVGRPFFVPCPHMNLEGCALAGKERKWKNRLLMVAKRWKFKFILLANSHTKLMLVSPDHCLFGGRNLSDSDTMHDLTFYTRDKQLYGQLCEIFEKLT